MTWGNRLLSIADVQFTGFERWRPINDQQLTALECPAQALMFGGGSGGGKGFRLDEMVPTLYGWNRVGDLVAGDILFDQLGKMCLVTDAYPSRDDLPCFRVHFDNGTSIDCWGDHLWVGFNRADRRALARRNDDFRTKRRIQRASRAKGKN